MGTKLGIPKPRIGFPNSIRRPVRLWAAVPISGRVETIGPRYGIRPWKPFSPYSGGRFGQPYGRHGQQSDLFDGTGPVRRPAHGHSGVVSTHSRIPVRGQFPTLGTFGTLRPGLSPGSIGIAGGKCGQAGGQPTLGGNPTTGFFGTHAGPGRADNPAPPERFFS